MTCPLGQSCERKTAFYWQCVPSVNAFEQCEGWQRLAACPACMPSTGMHACMPLTRRVLLQPPQAAACPAPPRTALTRPGLAVPRTLSEYTRGCDAHMPHTRAHTHTHHHHLTHTRPYSPRCRRQSEWFWGCRPTSEPVPEAAAVNPRARTSAPRKMAEPKKAAQPAAKPAAKPAAATKQAQPAAAKAADKKPAAQKP